jgi:hypothetical protein
LSQVLGDVAAVATPAITPNQPVAPPARTAPARPVTAGRNRARRPAGWEYRVVSFQNYRGWRPRFVNGEEIAGWIAGPLLHDYLNAMGEDGWEVAGAASGASLYGATDHHQVYFKRPRPAAD